jgi:hypothetical protein
VTGCGLDGPDSIPGSVRFSSYPQRPDRNWDPPSFLANKYWGLFLRGGKAAGAGVKKVELYLHPLICLYGIMLNKISTGTALPVLLLYNIIIKY